MESVGKLFVEELLGDGFGAVLDEDLELPVP